MVKERFEDIIPDGFDSPYAAYEGGNEVCLDGWFTVEVLEKIIKRIKEHEKIS